MTSEELDQIAAVMRRVRDEKPEGWQRYAEACVAWFEYERLSIDHGWNAVETDRLFEIARKARPANV
jgi:hypothetical protein